MWQGLQTIKAYKGKASHVADTDSSLPDKLNTFFVRFEENNTEQPTWTAATDKNCVLPISVDDGVRHSSALMTISPPPYPTP
jgi:hypothetical protein